MNNMFFKRGIREIASSPSLQETLGKVKKIKDNGYFLDVEYTNKALGSQVLSNVPCVKNKYFNTPIKEGDLVILISISHLLENYLNSGSYNEVISEESYIAIPFCLKNDFSFKNIFCLKTENFEVNLDDESKTAEVRIPSGKLSIEANEVSIKSQSPMELQNIKDVLSQIVDSIRLAGAPVTTGSATTTPNPGLEASLNTLKTLVEGGFK